MNKNPTELLRCFRIQFAPQDPQPCWLRGVACIEKGVSLDSIFLSETGLGESSRLIFRALSSQEVELAADKAVVTTGYGGSTGLNDAKTGFPVELTRIEVGSKDYVLTENATWAKPAIDHASKLLRSIYENPRDAREIVKSGFRQLAENHSFYAMVRDMVNLLRKNCLIAA
ncbi:hypothetical protein [Ruegeria sp. HKCCA4633]|uniref:hypothetical protein n=1 Tax=Ruegeria sp. HKCCA4633 TaxID=2682983 RepID=UPI001488FAFE|nr:hypothetical protein [Ruegeria sp. HKCCA4633]